MLQLAEEIKAMVPETKSTITFEDLPQDDPQVRQPDITLAQRLLGWEPHVQRAEGLKRTLEYFREAIRVEDGQPAITERA
jgi:dTDP-glucose 4,6-dehydratase